MKIGTTRVETFSDSVMAIIITIMALSLQLPEEANTRSADDLKVQWIRQWPYFLAYGFSFIMIGIYWMNHHHLFHLLDATDEPLLALNLLFLFWISLVPLATATISANEKLPQAIAFYGAVLLLTTITLAIMRSYTIRKGLIHRDKDRTLDGKVRWVTMRSRTKSYVGAGAYLLAIVFAFININVAYLLFLLPPIIFFIPDGIDDEKLAEKLEEKEKTL